MAKLLALPLARITDANGDPLSGALLYAYLTGTTTPTSTYTTSALSVAHANPIVADSAGLLPEIFLDPDITYRFVAKTSAGAAISGMDFDPVSVASSGDVQYSQTGAGVVTRTVQDKLREFATFEDFGAVGDYDSGTGLGTDDTDAIQAAIDWCYNGGSGAGRAIQMTAKNFLCGQIDTHPYTTIIGTGRQTSAFWCKTGTTGKWWSDRGVGAQKLMLSGIAWYARDNADLTHIAEFGSGGTASTQFGTEGIIEGCWFRDAINGYGLNINANVGIVRDTAIWNNRCNLKTLGNGNVLADVILYGAGLDTTGAITGGPANVISGDISGAHWHGLHIEATATGGLPLKQNGDCTGFGTTISSSTGTTFSHLVEVDTATYSNVWNSIGLQTLGSGYTISNGVIKVGATYYGGTDVTPRVENYFAQLQVFGFVRMATATPASAAATGTAGSIAYDGSYIYVAVSQDTWKRVAISTW